MAQPAKRRIQPQLISTPQSLPVPVNTSPALGANQVSTDAQGQQVNHLRQSASKDVPDPKEDADMAIKLGMKGRRIYVPLNAASQEVNLKKILKAQGISIPALGPSISHEPALPGVSMVQKHTQSAMPLAGVIARLERQYVLRDEDESSSEEGSQGASQDPPEHSGDESGAEKGEAGIGEYNMEDDFLNDEEFADFFEGDRRRAKIQGFFINKGEIEKEDLEAPQRKGSPKAKKKAKKTAVENANATGKEIAQADGKKSKKRKPESPTKPAKEAKVPKLQSSEAEPANNNALDLSTMAALAGKNASKNHAPSAITTQDPQISGPVNDTNPAALNTAVPTSTAQVQPNQPSGPAQGEEGYTPSAEMSRALAALQELVEPAKQEEEKNPSSSKSIPKMLNPGLTVFACLLTRESANNAVARNQIIDQVTTMFEPLYSRSKFVKRLDSLAKGVLEDLSNAATKINDHIVTKSETLKVRQEHQQQQQQEGAAETSTNISEGYLWDKHLEHQILNYRNAFKKIHGDHHSDQAVMQTLLSLWPKGQINLKELMAALSRAEESPKAVAKAPRKSLEGGEVPPTERPSSAAPTKPAAAITAVNTAAAPGPSAASAADAVSSAKNDHQAALTREAVPVEPRTDAGNGAVAQPGATNNAEGHPTSGAPRSTSAPSVLLPGQEGVTSPGQVTDEVLLKVALQLGADDALLVESIREARNVRANIVTMVLMCAGAQGFNAQELVDKANALGLTKKDNGPWDTKMRRNAATAVRNSKHLVNIGSSRYAHIAFPGVKEKAALEAESRKKGKADSIAKAAPALSRGPSADLEAT